MHFRYLIHYLLVYFLFIIKTFFLNVCRYFIFILFLLLLTIEIFGIVSFDSWMMCLFVQATCGGCHMVVLARPRDQSSGDVTLEEDDVTEDYLEKPYVELLGDTADSSTLQRSLSARVRRRERVGREQTICR